MLPEIVFGALMLLFLWLFYDIVIKHKFTFGRVGPDMEMIQFMTEQKLKKYLTSRSE